MIRLGTSCCRAAPRISGDQTLLANSIVAVGHPNLP
jgi:hypothetical protein